MIDEAACEQRRHHGIEGVMHDAVAERRGGNDARLRIVELYFDIMAWPALPSRNSRSRAQFVLEICTNAAPPGFLRLPRTARGAAVIGAPENWRSERTIGHVVAASVLSAVVLSASRCAFIQPPIRRPVSSSARAACS